MPIEEAAVGWAPDRIEIEHGLYRVIAGARADQATANLYLGSKLIETMVDETVDGAVARAVALADQRAASLRAARSGDVPTAEEFAEILTSLAPKELVLPLLATHAGFPGATAAVAVLARVADVTEAQVEARYIRLSRRLSGLLGFKPALEGLPKTKEPLLVLAIEIEVAGPSGTSLTLRPQVAGAVRAIGATTRRRAS